MLKINHGFVNKKLNESFYIYVTLFFSISIMFLYKSDSFNKIFYSTAVCFHVLSLSLLMNSLKFTKHYTSIYSQLNSDKFNDEEEKKKFQEVFELFCSRDKDRIIKIFFLSYNISYLIEIFVFYASLLYLFNIGDKTLDSNIIILALTAIVSFCSGYLTYINLTRREKDFL